jgi:hypothetical protein
MQDRDDFRLHTGMISQPATVGWSLAGPARSWLRVPVVRSAGVHGFVRAVVFTVGDALGDALVRPGRVVVHLVSGQHAAQMSLPEDQHAV